jgi:hypothetical protein
MMRVRSASQTERGDLEISLLTQATLGELRAAREQAQRDFQMAVAQVDQLESLLGDLRRLAGPAEIPSALARRIREEEDKCWADCKTRKIVNGVWWNCRSSPSSSTFIRRTTYPFRYPGN